VSAADLLDDSADASRGRVAKVSNIDLDAPPASDRWVDDLARWAAGRPKGALPLDRCVVKPTAPELAGDQLIGVNELAQAGGIAPSTLRGYLSRGQNDVPAPQAVIGGRSLWSKPVAADWAERRRRSSEGVAQVLSHDGQEHSLSVGRARIQEMFTKEFTALLWDSPERRKRWALRHRTPEQVHRTAEDLAWSVADSLDELIPMNALTSVVRMSVLHEFAGDVESCRAEKRPVNKSDLHLWQTTATMLDWIIRHEPAAAQRLIGEIVGEAQRKLDVPPEVTAYGLRQALSLDSSLDRKVVKEFLDRSLPPDVKH
jgi:hypothetical protein